MNNNVCMGHSSAKSSFLKIENSISFAIKNSTNLNSIYKNRSIKISWKCFPLFRPRQWPYNIVSLHTYVHICCHMCMVLIFFFRPCVCAENRGKNIKNIYIYIFLLWRLARDAAVRVVVVGCCAQRLFPQPLTPWKPGVTHAHVLCDKLAFCCCCRLLLCCFPSQTILYFFFNKLVILLNYSSSRR